MKLVQMTVKVQLDNYEIVIFGINCFFIVSKLTELHDIHEPNLTFEGDNNVILQQASNFLLGYLKDCKQGLTNAHTYITHNYITKQCSMNIL